MSSPISLEDLPAELLVSIVQHLHLIRSYEPQSIAFKQKENEKKRLRENRLRTSTLASLCLTCKQLRMIATPVLYASFASVATEPGLYTLQLYCNTLDHKAPGLDNYYSDFLVYLEDRLSDHLGNSLSDMAEDYGEGLVNEYFDLLSSIIWQANNIQHINVASIETDEVGFWSRIVSPEEGGADPLTSFANLQNLQLQAHADQFSGPSSSLFWNIATAVSTASELTSLHVSGLQISLSKTALPDTFKTIQRLEFTASMLTFEALNAILSACNSLRHFTCEWSYLACWDGCETQPSQLHSALLKHASTLETLHIDMRNIRFEDDMTSSSLDNLGSLTSFTSLKILTICEVSLFGCPSHPFTFMARRFQGRLSTLLPDSLQRINLLMLDIRNVQEHVKIVSDWDLVEDCKHYFKNLKLFDRYGHDECDIGDPQTMHALRDMGISSIYIDEGNRSCGADLK